MQVDTDRIFDLIGELAHVRQPVKDKMSRLVAECAASCPHPDWELFKELPYAEGELLRDWIAEVISSEPPPFEIRGLWFGIANYGLADRDTSDLHFIGSSKYDSSDPDQEWAVYAEYRPQDAEANSIVLDQIYQIAYAGDGSLGNEAEWSLCLGYAVFEVAELLRNASPSLFASSGSNGVVVGFDEGDFVTLGTLEGTGITPAA